MASGSDLVATKVAKGRSNSYIAPYVAGSAPALPAQTVAFGGEWSGTWKHIGPTVEGVTITREGGSEKHFVDEFLSSVMTSATEINWSVSFELANDDSDTLALVYGATVANTPAASETPGYDTLTMGEELKEFSFGMEMKNRAGFVRRILFPRMVMDGSVETRYTDKGLRTYAVTLNYVGAVSDIVITNQTAAPTE